MPDAEGKYHDFEPERVCEECGNDEADCICEEGDEDLQDQAECAVCGMDEDDDVHQEDDE